MTEQNTPVDSYISANAPMREQCILKVERTIHTWLVTFPDGDDIELPTLRACEKIIWAFHKKAQFRDCLLYTSPSPRDRQKSRMPSSA